MTMFQTEILAFSIILIVNSHNNALASPSSSPFVTVNEDSIAKRSSLASHTGPILSSTSHLQDVTRFPICLIDSDCEDKYSLYGYACVQYFCYPSDHDGYRRLKSKEKSNGKLGDDLPFNSCRRSSDCKTVTESKDDDGRSGKTCYRKRSRIPTDGICLNKIDECVEHSDCSHEPSVSGGRCCKGFCCSQKYYDALKMLPCTSNSECEDLLLGDACCIDIMGSTGTNTRPNWDKICCSNPRGPYVIPPKNITSKDLQRLNNQILRMGILTESICESFEYDFMTKFHGCNDFQTTTTSTTTTTSATITKPNDKQLKDEMSNPSKSAVIKDGRDDSSSASTLSNAIIYATLTPLILFILLL